MNLRHCLLALALTASVTPAGAEVVAVVGAQSTLGGLSAAQVSEVFLGRVTRLPDGSVPEPLDLPEGATARDEFYQRIASHSAAQMKAYWARQIFTGRGRPPRVVRDAAELLRLLRQNPNAVGYLERSEVDPRFRILQ